MLLLILLISSTCAVYQPPPELRGEIDLELREYKQTSMGRYVAHISMQMLNFTASDLLDNLVISPIGIFRMLSLFANCARNGALIDAICKVLGGNLHRPGETVYYFASMTHTIQLLTSKHFNFANKIFFDHMGHLNDNCMYFERLYDTEVGEVNFLDEDHAVAEMNQWLRSKTKGYNKPIGEEMIHVDINTALLDVIYFIGHWHVGFSVDNTKRHAFYMPEDNLVKIGMMSLKTIVYFRQSDVLKSKLIELPYKNSFRMIIIFPNKRDGLPMVLSRLATDDNFYSELNELAPKYVDILLPMFDLSTTIDLKDALSKMGLKILFETYTDGIRDNRPTIVSTVLQSAFIRSHVQGASAGAYTGVHEAPDSSTEPAVLCHITHPFAFAVMHKDTIVLLGVYQGA